MMPGQVLVDSERLKILAADSVVVVVVEALVVEQMAGQLRLGGKIGSWALEGEYFY